MRFSIKWLLLAVAWFAAIGASMHYANECWAWFCRAGLSLFFVARGE